MINLKKGGSKDKSLSRQARQMGKPTKKALRAGPGSEAPSKRGRIDGGDAGTSSTSANSELDQFALFVVKSMMDEDIPPTPLNYQIFFEKLLEGKPFEFKKRVTEMLEAEMQNDGEHRAKMEKDIKDGFLYVKGIMQTVGVIYKNLNLMLEISKKRASELKSNNNQLTAQNLIESFSSDLDKVSKILDKQNATIKQYYSKTATILRDVETKAVYDSKFGVYNKRYLLKSLEQEKESVAKFGHSSTIIMTNIKDILKKQLDSEKDMSILLRIIAKLLLKTSRRSDIVAHYGDGVFVMLAKHTNIPNAQKACERIYEMLDNTSFFLGSKEVDMNLEIAIADIDPNRAIEDTLISGFDALKESGRGLAKYKLAAADEAKLEKKEA